MKYLLLLKKIFYPISEYLASKNQKEALDSPPNLFNHEGHEGHEGHEEEKEEKKRIFEKNKTFVFLVFFVVKEIFFKLAVNPSSTAPPPVNPVITQKRGALEEN